MKIKIYKNIFFHVKVSLEVNGILVYFEIDRGSINCFIFIIYSWNLGSSSLFNVWTKYNSLTENKILIFVC